MESPGGEVAGWAHALEREGCVRPGWYRPGALDQHAKDVYDQSVWRGLLSGGNDVKRAFGAVMTCFMVAAVTGASNIAAAGPPKCFGRTATIVGGPGDNRITGTPRQDVIVGLDGNDIIQGRGAGDRICGGRGRDVLGGMDGIDRLNGGKGRDRLDGGLNHDVVIGGGKRDRLAGGEGGDAASHSAGASGM